MKYNRFEELPVWQAAIDLAVGVFQLTGRRRFTGQGDRRSQLQRASVSVGNNIAEGFERGTTNELLTFIYIARGSAGEVRSMLHLLDRFDWTTDLKSEISNLKSLSESIARQLRGWAESLQNSNIKGQRHLTAASKEEFHRARRAAEFWEKIEKEHQRRFGPKTEEDPPPGER